MKRIMITAFLLMLVLAISPPVFAGTFRDDFEDGNFHGWRVSKAFNKFIGGISNV